MIKIYDETMNFIEKREKEDAHRLGLWHKCFVGMVFNPVTKKVFFQTIYPKKSYTFDRPDYINVSVGGHMEENETPQDGGCREAQEELGIQINNSDLISCGIHMLKANLSNTYLVREFQYLYLIPKTYSLDNFDLTKTDGEVKSIIETDISEALNLFLGIKDKIPAKERIFPQDRSLNNSLIKDIYIDSSRVIPEYFTDLFLVEMLLKMKEYCS